MRKGYIRAASVLAAALMLLSACSAPVTESTTETYEIRLSKSPASGFNGAGLFILSGRGSHTLSDLNAWKSRPIKGMILAIKAAIVLLKAGKSGRRQKPSMEAKRPVSYPGSRMTRRR